MRRHRSFEAAVLGWAVFPLLLCVAGDGGGSCRGAQDPKEKPLFLVARRKIVDPFFEHSVVLMVPLKETPLVVGVIVNKPTKIPLIKLYPESPALKDSAATAYFGGPVEPKSPCLIFHAPNPPAQSIALFGDVYLTFDPQVISGFLQDQKEAHEVRVLLGRAQWAPAQLEAEMLQGAWYSIRADGDLIFDPDSARIWRRLRDRAGGPVPVGNFTPRPVPSQLIGMW